MIGLMVEKKKLKIEGRRGEKVIGSNALLIFLIKLTNQYLQTKKRN